MEKQEGKKDYGETSLNAGKLKRNIVRKFVFLSESKTFMLIANNDSLNETFGVVLFSLVYTKIHKDITQC